MEQLVEQYRSFRVCQQKLHEEERRVWQKEREQLHSRIQELEDTVASLLYKSGGSSMSPTSRSSSGFGMFPPQPPPPVKSTGREVWRGPETQPTRTFSDVTGITSKAGIGGPLASIPERSELPERKKSVGFADDKPRGSSMPASIPGEYISPHYDGINLKPNLLPPEIIKTVAESDSQSLSPLHSPSPLTTASPLSIPISEPRPKLIDIPSTKRYSESLYTQDAGHTPLAQVTGEESLSSSMIASPNLKPLEVEQPPYEPAPSAVRPPKERADSYFPSASSIAEDQHKENVPEAPPDDPALKGPLSLSSSNNKSEDVDFLGKVDSLLDKQAKQLTLDGQADAKQQEPEGRKSADTMDGEEDVPKLKIKRSMNFGRPLGQGF